MKRYSILLTFLIVIPDLKAQSLQETYIKDVAQPVISLDGEWEICLDLKNDYWNGQSLKQDWKKIQVPGEVMMQGYPIKHDKPFVYRKTFKVPHDYQEKITKLRFEGVYSYARLWVNGTFIRDHHGGFTAWECNISQVIRPGETATLILEVTDRADEISYASGYAKHQIGGILRSVNLLALPNNYPTDITIKTDFDETFMNATLLISGTLKEFSDDGKVLLELLDKNNHKIQLKTQSLSVKDTNAFLITNTIKNPLKWDSEHPNLYALKVLFKEYGEIQWHKKYKIGFREITIEGNKFLINGEEVKLRGACRHDIHPLLGRVSTPEYELKDVMLAKEANMNFIRTSHYPPTENFLQLCDEYGLYVEDETAVCFVGSHRIEEYRPGASESDPDFNERYLSQLAEMVINHKNHPSVIIWSIGNENSFGTNFKKSYDWVKENDDTRPVIFSYPGNVPDDIKAYEILSMHYPPISGDLNQYGKKTVGFGYTDMPVIFDEWAHVACYNNFTVKEDPNIRDFWGRSLDMMWKKILEADGGLGGAIWGMIDETFMLPDTLPGFNEWWGKIDKNVIPAEYSGNTIGYGEWGIVDTWRRKKPEFWNTKKAYSPVKLLNTVIENYTAGSPIIIPVYNRFNHTDFDELTINLKYKEQVKTIPAPSIKPHTKGKLQISMQNWEESEPIILEFYSQNNRLIDKYALRLKSIAENKEADVSGNVIKVEENKNLLTIICQNDIKIIFDKKSGLMREIQKQTDTFSVSGPFIHLRQKGKAIMYSYHEINDYGRNWQLSDFYHEKDDENIVIEIKGTYNSKIPANLKLTINANGKIKTHYQVKKIPDEYIREIGIKYVLEDNLDSISWKRQSYWSYYPPDHLSTQSGIVSLYPETLKTYRIKPDKNWNLDMKSFYYNGIEDESRNEQFSNIAKSTKENILAYDLIRRNHKVMSVHSNGAVSCRIAKVNGEVHLLINNIIDYVDLSWGNLQKDIKIGKNYDNEVVLEIR